MFKKLCVYLLILSLLLQNHSQHAAPTCNTFNETSLTVKTNKTPSKQKVNSCLENELYEEVWIETCIKIIEAGTFKNMPKLSAITMDKINIQEIQPNFIENLPKLKYITVTNNPLEDIKRGAFSNIPFVTLDLEGNKINRIQANAFENTKMEVLSLNFNNLRTIESKWFKNTTISNLQVVGNRLSSLSQNTFDNIKGLTMLDLYDNNIYYIEDKTFSRLNELKLLDLSENMLTKLNFLTDTKMNRLMVGMNMISSTFLTSTTTLKRLMIYPNPWRCECLRAFWAYTSAKNITVDDVPKDVRWKDDYPICSVYSDNCDESDPGDDLRKSYFKNIRYAQLLYNSIYD